MAELVLSALLPVLFEKLASAALKNIARSKGVDAEIKKWKRSLNQIQGLLADASQNEIPSLPVKRWLNDLQHLAYDIDDVLDELATEAIHRELNREPEASTSKVRKLIPTCCTSFKESTRMVNGKLDGITKRLQDLLDERVALGLSEKEESRSSKHRNRRLQTSMVHTSSIIGLETEKDALVLKLLEVEPACDQNFSVVPIVGIGGVGKTTFAKLLYDDKQVKDHFELKAWICVSDDFDSFDISKVIFQSVAGVNKEFADLNLLQVDLKDHLREKRFLFVLDDVWSESYEDWETLVGPFHACAPGSKIIMTTRKKKLLQQLGYDNPNELQCLKHDNALHLLAQHALGVNNFDSHFSLKPYGEGIVEKCKGLPLALIALGRLLRTKKNEEEYWQKVLHSEIWRINDGGGILPALRLSYNDLSASLKQIFAYCSLFPKDYMFDKDELVLLWMAEGFLNQSTSNDTIEHSGHEYFDELFSRSFFQHAPDNKSLFVMHDLMNDLASSIAGEFFLRIENETEKSVQENILKTYRHMSFVHEEYVTYKKFEAFKGANNSRTFLALGKIRQHSFLSDKILVNLLIELPLLRVLSLSDFHISELPESIGILRHLRYLNLSQTRITHLPKSICNLYNLQTLIVFGCNRLTNLPKSFFKLKNLRHLDMRDTQLLDRMPLGIGELKNLQTLSKIIIGGVSGFEINELKEFKNLCGKISIVGLDKVQNAIHAREANFSEKKLSEVEVRWSDVIDGSRNEILEMEVMNELKPCSDHLKQLKIWSYGGLAFPTWVGDPSFLQLSYVSICECKKCTTLPPLGQLPALKELFIEGLDAVKVVGVELLGTGISFPSLEILSFRNMYGWEKWSADGGGVLSFPCIRHLHIINCPNLVEVSLKTLPSLIFLEIERCESGAFRRVVQVASSVTKLDICHVTGLNEVVWRGILEYLQVVEELTITDCNELRYLWEPEAIAGKFLMKLRKLKVDRCDNLVSLGEKEEDSCRSNFLTSLAMLDLYHCKNMVRCSCPASIDTLIVHQCFSMRVISLPTGGQKLKYLNINGCKKLSEADWGDHKIINNTRSMSVLEVVDIYDWPNLKSIYELNSWVRLATLKIINCGSLESFPDNELSNLASLKCIHISDCLSINASFPRGFWPPKLHSLTIGKLRKPISEWGRQNFPTSLVELYLYGDDGVDSCFQFSHILPSSVTRLEIKAFEKLKSFSIGLQHLTSLQHLSFEKCPKMMNLPKVLLPSLLSLTVKDNCQNLTERCREKGYYWPVISHIPCVNIYPLHS